MTHPYPRHRKGNPRAKIAWTDELKANIIGLYNSGLNCGRVAAKVGISESSVQNYIITERESGTPLRDAPHGRKSNELHT